MSAKLTEVRISKGKTQIEMAKMLGIAVSTYSMYENGQRKTPEEIATRISEILGQKRDALFLPATFTVSKINQETS